MHPTRGALLLEREINMPLLFTRLSLFTAPHSRGLQLKQFSCALARPHISIAFQRRIRFALLPFRSLLLGQSQLFSFPIGTKMFQFPMSALSKSTVLFRQYVSHLEIARSMFACNSLALIAACHVLHRSLSQAIRLTALKIF
jgi:hypothetical protein